MTPAGGVDRVSRTIHRAPTGGTVPALSVMIITKNERANLPRAIRSVAFADEIVVVDGGSVDGTPALARALGATVFHRDFTGFADQKNHGLDQCAGDWILVLDADEEVPPALAGEILRVVAAPEAAAYALPRRSLFLGRWIRHSGWFPDYTTRLFARGRARFAPALVHESLAVEGTTARLDPRFHLDHYTNESLEGYLDKLNRYTTLAAFDLAKSGRGSSLVHLAVLPPFIFFKQYVLRQGFRDGVEGFILAALSAFYVFVKFLKRLRLDREAKP